MFAVSSLSCHRMLFWVRIYWRFTFAFVSWQKCQRILVLRLTSSLSIRYSHSAILVLFLRILLKSRKILSFPYHFVVKFYMNRTSTAISTGIVQVQCTVQLYTYVPSTALAPRCYNSTCKRTLEKHSIKLTNLIETTNDSWGEDVAGFNVTVKPYLILLENIYYYLYCIRKKKYFSGSNSRLLYLFFKKQTNMYSLRSLF